MPSRGGISSDLLLVQTQTDRQRYVEVLWKVDRHFLNYFSLKSRRGPVTPPASRQSATQKFSARMLEICNFRLPWYLWGWWPPTYWADCLVEMREIDQGGDQRGVGGAHIWQQLMPTSFCKLCFWGHIGQFEVIKCNYLIYRPLWGVSIHLAVLRRLLALTHRIVVPLSMFSHVCAFNSIFRCWIFINPNFTVFPWRYFVWCLSIHCICCHTSFPKWERTTLKIQTASKAVSLQHQYF